MVCNLLPLQEEKHQEQVQFAAYKQFCASLSVEAVGKNRESALKQLLNMLSIAPCFPPRPHLLRGWWITGFWLSGEDLVSGESLEHCSLIVLCHRTTVFAFLENTSA